jgi:predicted PurR-regulated permease PerM
MSGIDQEKFRKIFLLILVAFISFLFFRMIDSFLVTLFMAAILSGMSYPLYKKLLGWCRGHQAIASGVTIVIVLVVIIVPLTAFFGLITAEAVQIAQGVAPWVEQQIQQPNELERLLERLPFAEPLAPYQDQIATKAAQLAGNIGTFIVNSLAAGTKGTATFFFHLFVMLYAMFFFLMDGRTLLNKILYYMPLAPEDENRMVEKFVSVARATIKGTLIIGIVQGGLGGLAFAVVGIKGAAFWGTVMGVLSIIPGVGTALIWLPADIMLFASGHITAGILLFIWCAAVVGTADNILRPWLVGKDTKMPDLLIMLGTLGGLLLFGAAGIVIGPIIAALFVTIWDIYGHAFKGYCFDNDNDNDNDSDSDSEKRERVCSAAGHLASRFSLSLSLSK